MSDSQASDNTDADSEQARVPAVRLGTKWTDWEHKRRGVPASEVDGVPDGATTWTCLERETRGVPVTLTIYRTPTDEAVVLVTVDDEREEVAEFDDVNAAAADTQDLMAEYGNCQ